MQKFWKSLSSLKLTVACLGLGIILVFVGTVAQADEGLYQAQARYFKQWYVWAPILWGHKIPILLPGGYLLGSVLVLNLVLAHIQRFVWSARKLGIHLTHLGIVVLLIGQLATDMLSEESYLRLNEGESKSYSESHREHELVFIREGTGETEEVISIPEAIVAQGGQISHPKLPFTVEIKEYQINSRMTSRQPFFEAAGQLAGALATVESQYTTAEGLAVQAQKAVESEGRAEVWRAALTAIGEKDQQDIVAAAKRIAVQPEREGLLRNELKTRFQKTMLMRFRQEGGAKGLAAERIENKGLVTAEALPPPTDKGAGPELVAFALPETREMDMKNLPYTIAEIFEGGQSRGKWILSPWLDAQDLELSAKEGPKWRAAFRPERFYQGFAVKLLKTTHEVYPGTDIPKNFQSRVALDNPGRREKREVDIYMNNPLRYEGLTLFQYQMGKDERDVSVGTSTLQVVRNPSWLTPYLGCFLVGLGMTYQFGFHLFGFVSKRKKN